MSAISTAAESTWRQRNERTNHTAFYRGSYWFIGLSMYLRRHGNKVEFRNGHHFYTHVTWVRFGRCIFIEQIGEELMNKQKVYSAISYICTMALIVIAVFSKSVPLAIISGAFLVADVLNGKEITAKTEIKTDGNIIVVTTEEIKKNAEKRAGS